MFRLNQVYESINTINISIRCFSESEFTKKKIMRLRFQREPSLTFCLCGLGEGKTMDNKLEKI